MSVKKTEEERKDGYVTIELFKDNGKYKDDVPVIVNGTCYQIQRGKRVQVPEIVAEVVEQSLQQDRAAANIMDDLEMEFQTEIRKYS